MCPFKPLLPVSSSSVQLTNAVVTTVAFLVAQTIIVLFTTGTLQRSRVSNDDFFRAGTKDRGPIETKTVASHFAEVAAGGVVTGFAFWVGDGDAHFAISRAVILFTAPNLAVVVRLKEMPWIATATSVHTIRSRTEQAITAPTARTDLVAVNTKSRISTWADIVA